MRWLFRFADRKNISVESVLKNYSRSELNHWQVYCAREPTENQKIEMMLAQMLSIYINSNSKKGTPQKSPDDFIIKSIWKTEVEQDVDTLKKAFGIKK